jgi:hypothetical protein
MRKSVALALQGDVPLLRMFLDRKLPRQDRHRPVRGRGCHTPASAALGQLLDTSHPASAGDILLATVSGVDVSVANNTTRVQLTLSSIPMPVMKVTAVSGNAVQVAFLVSQSFGGFT